MEQIVEDFGSIKEANIQMRPLTVIIGKNCVGKSYFASLLYAILTVLRAQMQEEPINLFFRLLSPNDLEKAVRSLPADSSEKEVVGRIIVADLEKYREYLERSLKTQLESIFGIEINRLIRLGASDARIRFELSEDFSLIVTLAKPDRVSLSIKIDNEKLVSEVMNALQKRARSLLIKEVSKWRRAKRPSSRLPHLFSISFMITQALFKAMTPKELVNAVYIIPAGRAGLLEGYNTVQSALLSLSPIAPIQGVSMPPIPGPASEFYKLLLGLQGRKGPFYSLVEDFENLLGGKITIKSLSKPKGKTTITYSFKSNGETGEIDIIHAASGVKELAILHLIITELVRKGDFLIIEEPESHLHPYAQIRLVEIISSLVKKGVLVLVTTHSDLLLRKMAQLTAIHKQSKGKDPSSLNPDDFAAYLFKESRNGSVSKRLSITGYGSLEEIPTFDEVIRELYQKGVSLQTRLQMKE